MPSCICHDCAVQKNNIPNFNVNHIFQTTYQVHKFIKHTALNTGKSDKSIFLTRSTAAYDSYSAMTYERGFIEVEDNGNHSLIAITTDVIGTMYSGGFPIYDCNGVKTVLTTSQEKIHTYPISSTQYASAYCRTCGSTALF
jgi:hypothetical protein